MTRTTIAQFLTAAACAPLAIAGGPNPRDIQIRSVDFDTGILEIYNCGSSSQDLDGWRFCTHDADEVRRYTAPSALNGVVIPAGGSIFIHFMNNAGADPTRINVNDMGPMAMPLDQDAYGMQLYNPDGNGNVSFGNSSLIADHVQWIDAGTAGNAEFRTGQAVSEGLWTATGDFVQTMPDTARVELTDDTCGTAHGPANYAVTGPDCPADVNGDGTASPADFTAWLACFNDPMSAPFCDRADVNGSGAVDPADFTAWLAAFNMGCP